MSALAVASQPAQPVATADDRAPQAKRAAAPAKLFASHLDQAAKPTAKPLAQNAPTEVPDPETSVLAQIIAALVAAANATLAPTSRPAPVVTIAPVTTPTIVTGAAAQVAATALTHAPTEAHDELVQQVIAITPTALPPTSEVPLTPLEQAVHDALAELADHKPVATDEPTAAVTVQLAPTTTISAPDAIHDVAATAHVAQPAPQELVSQNHAHLVFDDPNGRVVMTVAVRGADVSVTMRASDDATAASLARNAGTLEDAMRGRGLQLAQFDTQRDLAREHTDQDEPERESAKQQTEHFSLEETT